jgi:cyanuric acid amidohydrolase
MATRSAAVHRVAMPDPGDGSGLAALLDAGALDARAIVCVMGKTPGNGLTNDHTREFATRTVAAVLAPRLGIGVDDVRARVMLLFSGGTEGILAPHLLVFSRGAAAPEAAPGPALAIGLARSRALRPNELGRAAQLDATADAVRAALADTGLADPAAVAWVQVKCPIPPPGALHGDAVAGIKKRSRAASALGVAVALGDVARGAIETDGEPIVRPDLGTRRACVTAAIDSARVDVMVLANAPEWRGDFQVGSTALADMLDAPAVAGLLRRLGLGATPQLTPAERTRLVGAILKGDPPADGRLRDAASVMLDDSDIHAIRHYRAALGGMLGALTGDSHVYLSAGAEHQAPTGGAVLALIARRH